jgi:hypothetical protein
MEPLDLTKYRTEYSARVDEAVAETDTIMDFDSDPDDSCFRDCSGDYRHPNGKCPFNSKSWSDLGRTVCPFEKWYINHDHIRWIDTAKFLSCYFRNPAGACSQKILHGIIDHRFICYYRCVLSAIS